MRHNRKKHQWIKRAAAMTVAAGFCICAAGVCFGVQSDTLSQVQSVMGGQSMGNGVPKHPENVTVIGKNETVQMEPSQGGSVVTFSEVKSSTAASKTTSNTTKTTSNTSSTSGPASVQDSKKLQIELEKEGQENIGPQVKEVTLQETYHGDYEVYTESIDGRFFIYSNVGNNGMTEGPAYVDIPQNISYRVEKDGAPFIYASKQNLTETGTYVFYFTAVKDENQPLSKQVIYETTLNFRIQSKPPAKEEETQAQEVWMQTSGGNYGMGNGSYGMDGNYGTGSISYGMDGSYGTGSSSYGIDGNYGTGSTSYGMGENYGTGSTSYGMGENYGTGSTSYGMDGSYGTESGTFGAGENGSAGGGIYSGETGNTEAGNSEGENMAGENGENTADESETKNSGSSKRSAEYTQTYNAEKGMYKISFSEEEYFYSNVLNGMLWNTGVTLDIGNLGPAVSNITVLKDGLLYEMPSDGMFTETGSYTLLIPWGESQAVYSFYILKQAHADLDGYTLPQELRLVSVLCDMEEIPAERFLQGGAARLLWEKDGSYRLTVQNEEGISSEIQIHVDHEAPKFSLRLDNHVGMLSYQSGDIEKIVVTKDGVRAEYAEIYQLTDPGSYTVDVYDYAGNVMSRSIVIPKRVNIAGFIAIAIVVALVTAAVLFYKKTKKSFDVK